MNLKMETVLAVIAAVFVLFSAMIDPRASFAVALVGIVFVLGYMVMMPKERKLTKVSSKKQQTKKSSKKVKSKK